MSNLLKSKIFLGVVIVAVVAVGVLSFTTRASAACDLSTTTLKYGMRSDAVLCLQQTLNVTPQTGYFGSITKAAVLSFQSANGLTADGLVGPLTKAALSVTTPTTPTTPTETLCPNGNTLASNCTTAPTTAPVTETLCPNGNTLASNCTTAPGTPTPSTTLTGGAGSVEEYKLLSSPANLRKVGEGAKDTKVLGASIKADDGSDIQLTALRLVFDRGGDEAVNPSDDFEDYAKDVAIWLGTTELARVDGDQFNDDNDFSKTISLASGGIIKAGQTGNLYITISGIRNIDSDSEGEEWNLDIPIIRFVDAQGGLISEDPDTAGDALTRDFSFETFAAASDVELKLTKHPGNPDAQVIEASASDETNDVLLLKANLKAIGSDIKVKKMTFTLTPAGTGTAGVQMASRYILKIDGEEIQALDSGDCDVATNANCTDAGDDADYVFDDVDYTIDAGDTVTVELLADIAEIDGVAVVEGDSLVADIDNDETYAKDKTGETLGIGDLTGNIVGKEQAFYSEGIKVTLVSATGSKTAGGDPAHVGDTATFVIKYKVEAFGSNAYIYAPLVENGSQNAAGEGTSYLFNDGAGITNGAVTVTASSTGDTTANNNFEVIEGETETITVTIVVDKVPANTTEFIRASLEAINWSLADIAAPALYYDFNLDKYETNDVYTKNAS